MRIILSVLFALCVASGAQAQGFPTKPVTIIVPFAAGGPTDSLARAVSDRMRQALGQPVIIENVTGAGGTIGVTRAAKSPADGYTISMGHLGTHVVNGAIYPLPFDLINDLEPLALLGANPMLIVSKNALPAKTLPELIAWLKANQDKATMGTAGVGSGSHFSGVYFQSLIGTHIQYVPYRGTGPAMQDLIAGRIDFLCDIAVTAVQSIKGGTVKGLANLSGQRSAVLPDLPTAAEKGFPAVQAYTWTALFLPKGTPAEIANKLNAATVAAMNGPGLQEQMNGLAATLVAPERRTPAYLTGFVKNEWDKWGAAIRAGNAIPK
jgi:tripartite-type tricarboxylate transporter receptor subunit TctC